MSAYRHVHDDAGRRARRARDLVTQGPARAQAPLEVITPDNVQAIENEYEDTFESALASKGVQAEVLLALLTQKCRLNIKRDKKAGTARAHLMLSLRFEGLGNAPAQGVSEAPLVGRGKFKGKSDAIEAAGILAIEETN